MNKRKMSFSADTKGVFALILCFFMLFTSCVVKTVDKKNEPDTVSVLSKVGSTGQEVRSIQKKLKQLGYYTGNIDGIYGAKTQAAVKAFQRNCGIKADGIAGPTTLLYMGLGGGSSNQSTASSSDVYLLAKLIAAEARGESYTGQVAVGAVVLNRVDHASFPDSIAGVIYQPGAFSCVRDSNWSVSPDATSQRAAKDALNGWDPSGGAIYYYNPKTAKSQWIRSRPVICSIGSHVFCS